MPYYTPEKIWHLYEPFVDYLNKTTDIKWELKLYHNYESIIQGICGGEISVALLGPVALGKAYEKCRAKPLLVSLGKDGAPYYRSVIITNDFDINSLKDLKEKKFALLKGSTAADVVPRKMLADEGITFEFISPVFYESHDRIINALLTNDVTAAGVKESMYEKFRDSKLKILKRSWPLPNYAFCAQPSFSKQTAGKFINALLRLKPLSSPDDKNKVRNWDDEVKNGFILPTEYYQQNIMKLHDLYKEYEMR